MNRIFLAGGALLFLTCGTAAANSTAGGPAPGGFDISVGGDAYFTRGFVNQTYDSTDKKTIGGLSNRFRFHITPMAVADNGLEYGATLRFRAHVATGAIDADQAYLFLNGRLGRVEAGLAPGINSQWGVVAPSGFGTGGVVGDWSAGSGWIQNQNTYVEGQFGGGWNIVTNTDWATRINYFSPRLLPQDEADTGLMIMISYAPKNLSIGTHVDRSALTPANASNQSLCAETQPAASSLFGCGYRNIIEPGLRYDAKFHDIHLAVSAGYEHGDSPADTNGVAFHDLSAYQIGVNLGYGGWLIGGSYSNAGKSSYTPTHWVAEKACVYSRNGFMLRP